MNIDRNQEKIVAILGGMGPESTADFFFKLIKATPAKRDQDHLRIIIDNNPKVPDRTKAILGKGVSPLTELKEMIDRLVKSGAEIIAIPCNTAHYYFKDLQASTRVPIINMIDETAIYMRSTHPEVHEIGLLATTGTIQAKLYHRALKGIELISPGENTQQRVMDAIYGENGIKAGFIRGKPRRYMLAAARELVENGAAAIIMGCTEISLVLRHDDLIVPLIDPIQILAEATVAKACKPDIVTVNKRKSQARKK